MSDLYRIYQQYREHAVRCFTRACALKDRDVEKSIRLNAAAARYLAAAGRVWELTQ